MRARRQTAVRAHARRSGDVRAHARNLSHGHEVTIRRKTFDGKLVEFWSDGAVTLGHGMNNTIVARGLSRDVVRSIEGDVSLYDAAELPMLVAAGRKADRKMSELWGRSAELGRDPVERRRLVRVFANAAPKKRANRSASTSILPFAFNAHDLVRHRESGRCGQVVARDRTRLGVKLYSVLWDDNHRRSVVEESWLQPGGHRSLKTVDEVFARDAELDTMRDGRPHYDEHKRVVLREPRSTRDEQFAAYRREVRKHLVSRLDTRRTTRGVVQLSSAERHHLAEQLVDGDALRLVEHWYKEGADARFAAQTVADRRRRGEDYDA